jgi:hypothetical protein
MSSDSANVSQSGIIKRLENRIELALIGRGARGIASSNNVSAVAAATGAAQAVPYVAIAAPSITKKVSGNYLVTGFVTIDKNGGTLAAGDAVVLTPRVNGVQLGTFLASTAAVASGATVQAMVPFSFIAATAGGAVVIDMQVTTAGGHTSSVLVNNGFISVIELAG